MVTTTNARSIGLKQANVLTNMRAEKRIEFIAEGLPIILESARSFINASAALDKFPREIEVLDGHAEEECAKILILVDLVRCPPKLTSSRVKAAVQNFYNHLARMIYVKAQHWSAPSVTELQRYVNNERPSHYLEGANAEFILPNPEIYRRESLLYADVVGNEDADPSWNSPTRTWNSDFGESMTQLRMAPNSFRLAETMSALGMFSVEGLKIVNKVWGQIEFSDTQGYSETLNLSDQMLKRLSAAGLITDRATDVGVGHLVHRWQMPMYNIDFSMIEMSLEELREARDRNTEWGY